MFINDKFYRHRSAYEVAMDALISFGEGNQSAKLNCLIEDFEEHEVFDKAKVEGQQAVIKQNDLWLKIKRLVEFKPCRSIEKKI